MDYDIGVVPPGSFECADWFSLLIGYEKRLKYCDQTRDLISQNDLQFLPKDRRTRGGSFFPTAAVWLAWASPSVGEK